MSRVLRSRQFLSTALSVALLGALLYACTESTFAPVTVQPPNAALSPADQALALQKIAQLNAQVTAFRQSGAITTNKVANSLSKILDKATRAVRMGDATGGIRAMNEFKAYVDSQPNSISSSAATVLKTLADEIIQILSRNSNAAPTATISSPANGSTFQVGASINFSGSGSDAEDGPLTGSSLVWTSSIDGQIGTGTSFSRSLSLGVHTVTLTATDSQDATGTASVQITIQPAPNQPPTATIASPANQSVHQVGATINFSGSGSDTEDGALSGASLVWTSNIDGQLGTGTSFTRTLSVGAHTITLTATDSKGATGTASVQIRVNAPPTATITSPTDQSVHQAGASINFSGSGNDAEDGALTGSRLVWTSSIDGQIGTGTSFSRTLSLGAHTITLTATDSNGATGTATVHITVQPAPNQPPTATITSPANQSVFQLGATINFSGSGSDPEDGALSGASLVWTSNIDGQIGTGTSFSRPLSVGAHTITLTATDSNGATGVASIQITVAPNQSPTASITAPANQSVHQASATINFSGSGSDPEDGALTGASLVWTSSIDGQIGTGTTFSRTLSMGVHTITLTATDSKGATGVASVQIRVNAPPTATITAPADQSVHQVGAPINFSGSGNDPEDGALTGASLVWTSGINGQIGTGTSFSYSSLSIGTHTITLTVTDGNGATGVASIQITVQPVPNQAPTASITAPADQSVHQAGATINFSGSGSDPEDGALTGASLVWTSNIDGQIGTGTSFSRTLSIGVHTITLTATDSKGATGTASVPIRVNAPPTATITSPADQSVHQVGTSINFSGSGNDAEDGALTGAPLVWTSSIDGQIGTGTSFSRTLSLGAHTITLTATDSNGATGTATVQITIQPAPNQPPTATITAPVNQSVFQAGATISFSGSGNDPEDGGLNGASLVWTSSSDGQIGTGTSFSRTLSVGVHTITLTATDSKGATGTASVQIRVNAPPTATITSPIDQSVHQAGATINFSGSGSDPEDGALTGAALVWTSSIDGQIGTGTTFGRTLSVGLQTITLTATDSKGATGSASVQIRVNAPPTATITAPANQSLYQVGTTINFSGSGNDPEDGALTGASLVWTSNIDGQIGTGTTFGRTLSVGLQTITLTATDSKGATGSASVQIRVNAPPTAAIASPATGSTFIRLSDAISFQGSGNDAENGALSGASLVWTSSIDGQIGTGTSFTRNNLSFGTHVITLTATDLDGATGTASITIEVNGGPISMPATLNVAYTQTASLPLQLVQPAGPGGVVVSLTSSDPSRVSVTTPTVTIQEGQITANGTVQGMAPGSATVTATATHYLTRTSLVTTLATLNILQNSLNFTNAFPVSITIQLESNGAPAAAPPGGTTITISANDPACVAATSPVTIPAGQVQVTAAVSYGGGATLPCNATLTASAADYTSDAVPVTVAAAPPVSVSASTTGSGLVRQTSAGLGATNHGGVTATITSSNPGVLLVSNSASTAGTASTTVFVPNGTASITFWIHGLEAQTGTATVTVTAPGFADGSALMTVAQPALDVTGVAANTTTLSPDFPFNVRIGLPAPGNGSLNAVLPVRPGGSTLTVTVTNSVAAVGQLVTTALTGQTVTVSVPVGQSQTPTSVATGGVAFHSLGVGLSTIAATIPGFIQTTNGSQTVTVTGPVITVSASTTGSGLVRQTSAGLGATNHGGVTATITSSNPGVLLVSNSASTAGTASTTVFVPNGTASITFWIHGLEAQTGTATVTVTAPGFADGSALMTVAQPALDVTGVAANTTTLSPDFPFNVRIGLPAPGNGSLNAVLPVRPGGSTLTVTVTNSVAAVGQLVTTALTGQTVTVSVPVGQSQTPTSVATGGVAFHSLGVGLSTIAATIPGFIQTTNGSQTVTVTGPVITVSASTTGSGLVRQTSAGLGATNHGGVTATITSSNPGVLLVSNSASTAGTASTTVFVPNGTASITFWIHGLEAQTGTATVTVTAPGFADGSALMTVAQPALDITGVAANTTTLSPDFPFNVRIGLPAPGNGSLNAVLPVRPGGSTLTVTVTNSVAAVGQLVTTALTGQTVTVSVPVGQSQTPASVATGGVAFNSLGVGLTTIAATIPGFIQTTTGSRTVTVTVPGITVSASTTGSGLVRQTSAGLGATNHGGVTVTITSSSPGLLLVSNSASTAGTASTTVFVPNGTASVIFWIHGLEAQTGTTTVTASAPGFTDGSGLMTVVQPALDIQSLNTTTTVAAADDPFDVRIGLPATGNSGLSAVLPVRPGGNTLTVTVTNSAAAVGQLVTTPLTAQTVTVSILPGQSAIPASVAAGGVAFDAVGVGTTTIAGTIPGFIQTTAAVRSVTVN